MEYKLVEKHNESERNETMLNTDYYGKEYLRTADSEKVDEIELLREEILNDSSVEEFLENTLPLKGETAQTLVKEEILNPFSEFLRERIDYYICDFIISKIDDYPEEEYAELKRAADEKKRLLLAGANA